MISLETFITSEKLFDNRYRLIELIGRGGFSEVWLAQDTVAGMELALKIYIPSGELDESGKDQFKKEFTQLCSLNHTNIIHAAGFGIFQNQLPYLVMNVCRGGSAKKLIGTATEEQIWDFTEQVTSGLKHLHAHGIIHRDMKPDNVLVNSDGQYLIIDFGISTKSRNTLRKSTNGNTGSGTTWYMSVESFSSNASSVFARDIWALGATLYEIMTGDVPFGQYGGLTQEKEKGKIPPITQSFSEDLKSLVYDCLALNAWDRIDANNILQRVREHREGRKKAPKKHWKGTAAVAICSLLAFLSLLFVRPDPTPTPSPSPMNRNKYDNTYLTALKKTRRIVDKQSAVIMNQKEADKISIKLLVAALDEYPTYSILEDSVSEAVKEQGRIQKDSIAKRANEICSHLEQRAEKKIAEYGDFGKEAYQKYMSISDSIKKHIKLRVYIL